MQWLDKYHGDYMKIPNHLRDIHPLQDQDNIQTHVFSDGSVFLANTTKIKQDKINSKSTPNYFKQAWEHPDV